MCANRDNSGQDPFKALKPIAMEKSGSVLKRSMKAAVAIILIFTISLSVYSAFYGATRPAFFRWADVPNPTVYVRQLESDKSPTNISHIAFGIGGSIRTWENRFHYSDLWWKPNVTRGFVFLENNPDPQTLSRIKQRISSDWKKFKRTAGSESAVRIARVVVDLFQVGLPNVRWFVMGDDDTVFFTDNLVTVLAKYDHRRMVYVGGNSESVEQDEMHAYGMAFGGGGFAISYPLAAQLVSAMDGCLNRYHYFYGSDQRVWACVEEIGVGLSAESGFHQIDIRGDPFGLLAAHPVAPLVSLHHLDDLKPLFPNQTQLESLRTLMEAYVVDPSRTLQQCFCYHRWHEWSVSISWGYTVQIYPTLLTANELGTPLLTFKTWRSWKEGPFTFNTRPVSPDPCKQPVIFYLNSVKGDLIGETITSYKKFVATPVKNCNWHYGRAMAIENIIVSAPKMDPEEWKQRPRRHCCEINGIARGTMRIRIRRCKYMETLTI